MKRVAGTILALALSIGLISPLSKASAEAFSGNKLLLDCEGDPFQRGWCNGYIVTAAQMLDGLVEAGIRKGGLCIPNGSTNGLVQDVVVKYFRANPATRHESALMHIGTLRRELKAIRRVLPSAMAMPLGVGEEAAKGLEVAWRSLNRTGCPHRLESRSL